MGPFPYLCLRTPEGHSYLLANSCGTHRDHVESCCFNRPSVVTSPFVAPRVQHVLLEQLFLGEFPHLRRWSIIDPTGIHIWKTTGRSFSLGNQGRFPHLSSSSPLLVTTPPSVTQHCWYLIKTISPLHESWIFQCHKSCFFHSFPGSKPPCFFPSSQVWQRHLRAPVSALNATILGIHRSEFPWSSRKSMESGGFMK